MWKAFCFCGEYGRRAFDFVSSARTASERSNEVEYDCGFGIQLLRTTFTFGAWPFRLASGQVLQPLTLRYAIYGGLNRDRDNAILVCHALSGSARVGDWWPRNVWI